MSVALLPAQALAKLPASTTLVCSASDLAGDARRFWVTTSRAHWQAAQRGGYPCANGHEWLALAIAAAAGRCTLAVEQWLTPGAISVRTWFLRGSLYSLCGGELRATDSVRGWDAVDLGVTVGDVLEHFRAELVGIDPPLTAAAVAREGQL